MDAPDFPAGVFEPRVKLNPQDRADLIDTLEIAADTLRAAWDTLRADQHQARYRRWTAPQVLGHVADSHLHSYLRFKWTLSENHPTIKAYDETAWAELPGAADQSAHLSLSLIASSHAVWCRTLRRMNQDDFARFFRHPETGRDVALGDALQYYAWHVRHHAAQIAWIAQHR